MLESVNGTLSMGRVVGADADCVALARVDKLLVAGVEFNVADIVSLAESLSLAGDKIRKGDYLNVGALLIGLDMSLGYPTGADDAHLELFAVVTDFFVRRCVFEFIKDIL